MLYDNIKDTVIDSINKWIDAAPDKLDEDKEGFAKAMSLIEEFCAYTFPELHESLFVNDDKDLIFSSGALDDLFYVFYFNPDSFAGGTIVEGYFKRKDMEDIETGLSLYDVIAEYKQDNSDIDTHHFFNAILAMLEMKEKGRFLGNDINKVIANIKAGEAALQKG